MTTNTNIEDCVSEDVIKQRRKEWIKRLRNPRIRQTKGKLERVKKTSKYRVGQCCLGVACNVAIGMGIKLDKTERPDGAIYFGPVNEGSAELLPLDICDFYGIPRDGSFRVNKRIQRLTRGRLENGNIVTLTVLNDDGYRFSTIAAIIEAEPEWGN